MEDKTKLVAELVGAIRREGLNAIEASDALEEARRIYLSRCEHVTKKGTRYWNPNAEDLLSEEWELF